MGNSKKKKKKAIEFQIGWPGLIAIFVSTFCVLAWTFVLGFWLGQKLTGGKLTSSPAVTTVKPESRPEGRKAPGLARIEGVADSAKGAEKGMTASEDRAFNALKEELHLGALPDEGKGTGAAPDSSGQQGLADLPTELVSTEKPKEANGQPTSVAVTEKKKTKESLSKTDDAADRAAKLVKTAKKQEEKKAEPVSVRKPLPSEKVVSKKQTGKIVLQVASYQERKRADREAARWRKKGYAAQVKQVDLKSKGIWYRVYIGRYHTIEEAKKAAARLAAREGVRSYVVPNP